VHLVTRVHFRLHNKDGGYTVRSAVPENPMLHANITALCLIEQEFCWWKFYIVGIGIFDLFVSCDLGLDQTTFTYELDPYLFGDIPHMQILTCTPRLSKVIVWRHIDVHVNTDRHTDTNKIIHHAALRMVKNLCQCLHRALDPRDHDRGCCRHGAVDHMVLLCVVIKGSITVTFNYSVKTEVILQTVS